MNEFKTKQEQIQAVLERNQLDALLLERVTSFAWATCGVDTAVSTASTNGVASLLITRNNRYLITNNIECPRLDQEDGLKKQGWEFIETQWYENENPVVKLTKGLRLGTEGCYPGAKDVSNEVTGLRSQFTNEEQERFRILSRSCSEAMEETMSIIQPEMTEFQIASFLSSESEKRGVRAIANMVATDERIFRFRHPLPTEKKLNKYAMVILCGRKWGMVSSVTRLVHFGPLPAEIRKKSEAVAKVDATFIQYTRPGKTLGDVFAKAQQSYANVGYPEEWQRHHQGGTAGYEPREIVAVPSSPQFITPGQVFAWNPSIAGTKSEDTILVKESGNEILSEMKSWPVIEVDVGEMVIERPAILVR
jgi:Xaa-Pro aminopeptidase